MTTKAFSNIPSLVNVTDSGMAGGTITLLDMQGRTLAEVPSSQRTIDVSGLPAGTYILRLTAPDIAPIVHKLIIAQP